jgi:ADP-dependent NAD(P)H-hydrate dehydratase / NAD(P)H-hydrate epimerase
MPIPIITVSQMRQWEQATWAAKRTPTEVVSRVGHLVTTHARQLTRPGDSILILAGKGHNGDDARQVVLNLTDREVTLLNVTDPKSALREFKSLLSLPPALIVEGLFGIGLKGPLEADWARLIQAVNRSAIPILAVDVPAGLNADTGEPMGAAIRAAQTLTLAAPKKGLVKTHAAPYVGRLELVSDIGLIPCPLASELQWTVPQDFDGFPPTRGVDSHKGSYGHLAIIAGSLGYHGAAVLAARGALQAQPGLVTLMVPENIYTPVAAQSQAAMVRPWHTNAPLPPATTAVLFGPGMAAAELPPTLRTELSQKWKTLPLTMVADASGLDWLPRGKLATKATRVLTPHPGEAARLLGTTVTSVQADRPAALRALSARYGGAWVILKGHLTLIGRNQGDLYVNCSGNPWLAQGGSGDLLAGFLAALLAQPALAANPLLALRYAVWQHGATADTLTAEKLNWTVDTLAHHLAHRRNTGFIHPRRNA